MVGDDIKAQLGATITHRTLTDLFAKGDPGASFSRDELAALAKLGTRQGSLGAQEGELLENILQLRQTRTAEILTPRTVVSAA